MESKKIFEDFQRLSNNVKIKKKKEKNKKFVETYFINDKGFKKINDYYSILLNKDETNVEKNIFAILKKHIEGATARSVWIGGGGDKFDLLGFVNIFLDNAYTSAINYIDSNLKNPNSKKRKKWLSEFVKKKIGIEIIYPHDLKLGGSTEHYRGYNVSENYINEIKGIVMKFASTVEEAMKKKDEIKAADKAAAAEKAAADKAAAAEKAAADKAAEKKIKEAEKAECDSNCFDKNQKNMPCDVLGDEENGEEETYVCLGEEISTRVVGGRKKRKRRKSRKKRKSRKSRKRRKSRKKHKSRKRRKSRKKRR